MISLNSNVVSSAQNEVNDQTTLPLSLTEWPEPEKNTAITQINCSAFGVVIAMPKSERRSYKVSSSSNPNTKHGLVVVSPTVDAVLEKACLKLDLSPEGCALVTSDGTIVDDDGYLLSDDLKPPNNHLIVEMPKSASSKLSSISFSLQECMERVWKWSSQHSCASTLWVEMTYFLFLFWGNKSRHNTQADVCFYLKYSTSFLLHYSPSLAIRTLFGRRSLASCSDNLHSIFFSMGNNDLKSISLPVRVVYWKLGMSNELRFRTMHASYCTLCIAATNFCQWLWRECLKCCAYTLSLSCCATGTLRNLSQIVSDLKALYDEDPDGVLEEMVRHQLNSPSSSTIFSGIREHLSSKEDLEKREDDPVWFTNTNPRFKTKSKFMR